MKSKACVSKKDMAKMMKKDEAKDKKMLKKHEMKDAKEFAKMRKKKK